MKTCLQVIEVIQAIEVIQVITLARDIQVIPVQEHLFILYQAILHRVIQARTQLVLQVHPHLQIEIVRI